MNKFERIATIIIVLLVVIIASVAIYDFSINHDQNVNSSSSFSQEPIVDIIVPSLYRQTAQGGVNTPLNLSSGETRNFVVQIYPTVDVNLFMQFRSFSLSSISGTLAAGENSTITCRFNPFNLIISAGSHQNTTVSLMVSSSARIGFYTLVISAVDSRNSSEVWGVILQINVGNSTG